MISTTNVIHNNKSPMINVSLTREGIKTDPVPDGYTRATLYVHTVDLKWAKPKTGAASGRKFPHPLEALLDAKVSEFVKNLKAKGQVPQPHRFLKAAFFDINRRIVIHVAKPEKLWKGRNWMSLYDQYRKKGGAGKPFGVTIQFLVTAPTGQVPKR